ncbi:putative ABC transporter permease [Tissierella carlieri]|uniref:putative ABC transporter permease n=1 Tax=Tissierella carlieri TaxID=689904 RepID=UPI001C0F607E|nr:putative ABC transporter permease [Tissierella carlieri]MBU5311109.1 putative ABC transporter permease [Tissierella carlieri]
MKQLIKYSILFIIGGISYFFIEILWRGYSHMTMLILGGLCFVLVGLIGEHCFAFNKSLLLQQVISCLIITVLELVFGLILNVGMGLDIWDYSNLKFNFMGQICLKYSMLWFFLSLPTIILYDYIRYWIFGEEKPYYKFI